jgi:hypothetical protein
MDKRVCPLIMGDHLTLGCDYLCHQFDTSWPMAENIYSKGTRVWLEDKDQAWISAEVTTFSKSTGDAIKLIFLDERGKVSVPIFCLDLP